MANDKFQGWVGTDRESANGKMIWQEFEPKAWEETDIDIKVTHSGICGSDIHTLSSGWRETPYPAVVGHEIVGVAVRVGSKAEGNIKVGDIVGVGAQSDACLGRDGPCYECDLGAENYCAQKVDTYASVHRNGDKGYGGYALHHRCPSHFVFKIPNGLAPEFAAPMLCGGITVYAPLKHFGAGPGKKVAIAGVGGLGHFAVLFAKALGADEVVGISRKANKRQEAIELGCDDYIATDEENWSITHARRFDIIISTIASTKMPIGDYIRLLRLDGTIVQLGIPEGTMAYHPYRTILARTKIAGSGIGSPQEIREMLELAVEKDIKPWVQLRPMSEANQAMVDMKDGKARFRYVLQN